MGITGTTAAEAEKTISGSANAMKSAFENLLTGFGNADADMQVLVKNLADSLNTVIKNIIFLSNMFYIMLSPLSRHFF